VAERRLKNVFGSVRIPEDATADAQDHRPVPPKQFFESSLVAAAGERVQQFTVAQRLFRRPSSSAMEPAKCGIERASGHRPSPVIVPLFHHARSRTATHANIPPVGCKYWNDDVG
jgi:hypothetical protein